MAKKPPYQSSGVTMIDNEMLCFGSQCGWKLLADGTTPTLLHEDVVVLLKGQVVYTLKPIMAL
jgi:hypothetical protein